MHTHIVRIEDAGPDKKARRLVFDDGSEPRLTSNFAVRELRLEEGMPVDRTALEVSLAQVEPDLAKERALRLLGYRERSTAEVTARLRDSGYSDPIVGQVVRRLADLGLVDDVRFAGMWVRSRKAAGFGERRIARELAQKGIEPEIAAQALDVESGGELERALAALGQRTARDRKDRDRLLRRLVGRGFDLSVARRAVDTVSRESVDEP
jgi:regulatory protein